jgi:hypothetical protein
MLFDVAGAGAHAKACVAIAPERWAARHWVRFPEGDQVGCRGDRAAFLAAAGTERSRRDAAEAVAKILDEDGDKVVELAEQLLHAGGILRMASMPVGAAMRRLRRDRSTGCHCDRLSLLDLERVAVELALLGGSGPAVPLRVERTRAYAIAKLLGMKIRDDDLGRPGVSRADAVAVIAHLRADLARRQREANDAATAQAAAAAAARKASRVVVKTALQVAEEAEARSRPLIPPR